MDVYWLLGSLLIAFTGGMHVGRSLKERCGGIEVALGIAAIFLFCLSLEV